MKTTRAKNKILPLHRVLFTGANNTGKTIAAELIADQLKLNLYRVDLSAVVGKYIGETEKNLERLFAQADKNKSLLFFDEADALFGKRTEVKDSHDRYANQETAYLLRRLTRFPQPVVVSATSTGTLPAVWKKNFPTVIRFPRQPKSKSGQKSNGKKSRAPHRH